MSVLDKYAKPSTEERRDVSAAVRLEKSLLDRFTTHCKSRGLKVSEAIRYLIIEALEAAPQQQVNEIAVAAAPEEAKPKRKTPQTATTNGRKNTNKWKVGNQLPCPICNGWYSTSNFARDHAKKHGYADKYEFLKAYDQRATEMVEEYKNALRS